MSRRITFFVLATSAALIATQATADPECFGDTCHLPEVVEPPVAAAQLPEVVDATDVGAQAAVPAPAKALPQVVTPVASHVTRLEARQETRPADVSKVVAAAPSVVPIRVAADPVESQTEAATPIVAEDVQAPPAAAKPPKRTAAVQRPVAAPRPAVVQRPAPTRTEPAREYAAVEPAATAGYARSARVLSPEPAYTVTPTTAMTGAVVVVVPGSAYAGYRGAPGYLIAPGAKIISIDSDD